MDGVNMKELTVKWCPTKQMVADFMTKPIQGSHFRHLKDFIIGRVCSSKPKMETVNVDKSINNNKKKVNSKGRIKVAAQ
jgi:hypothetical protein